jgi:hypothetical protein
LIAAQYQYIEAGMDNPQKLLASYEVDVDFPTVSGMEHLQMLMTRTTLYESESQLSPSQKQRLLTGDQKLLQQAALFFEAIHSIAELPKWRQMEGVTAEQWWWYLDVLAKLPENDILTSKEQKVT